MTVKVFCKGGGGQRGTVNDHICLWRIKGEEPSALRDAVASCCSSPRFTSPARCACRGQERKRKRWGYSSYYAADEEGSGRSEELKNPPLLQSSNILQGNDRCPAGRSGSIIQIKWLLLKQLRSLCGISGSFMNFEVAFIDSDYPFPPTNTHLNRHTCGLGYVRLYTLVTAVFQITTHFFFQTDFSPCTFFFKIILSLHGNASCKQGILLEHSRMLQIFKVTWQLNNIL